MPILILVLAAAAWGGMHDAPYNGPHFRDGSVVATFYTIN